MSCSDTDIHQLLGSNPLSPQLSQYITNLAAAVSLHQPPTPEVKSYPDAIYFNYFSIGLSLLYAPKGGYKPTSRLKFDDIKHDKLSLDSIYVYNVPINQQTKGTSSRAAELAFSTYPLLPLGLNITPESKDKEGKSISRPSKLDVHAETSGKDFVLALGEPDRKGGGAGPSSGSIGIWCEWTKDGIMVEFGGDEAKGPQAWERGKDAIWKIITVFSKR
ncbi:hypothetical protein NLJ89_g1107 [Agrocybe chaxingu]|uniref:Uncharacterized protein n=1 Tax=Agrocybe chaxingu TaxID=84603 RepID=A0A9W8N0P3_9AGAR|nr:hypothetical protein NLJ89_g1107 [Agrocybe chaxingu]